MTWVLLALVLGAPQPRFWVEREGEALFLSADLSPMVDPDLRRRLHSGLTTTLFVDVALVTHEDEDRVGGIRRLARVRWDLWAEVLTVEHELPDARTETHPSVDAFLGSFLRLQAAPLADDIATDESVYRVRTRVEVNPVSAEQLGRMRRWLTRPGGVWALDPLGSGLLGSFVRLFHNLKPGAAERVLTVVGHPFRGDRLPFVQRRP